MPTDKPVDKIKLDPNKTPEEQEMDKAIAEVIQRKIASFLPQARASLVSIKANIAYLCGHQNIAVENGAIQPLEKKYATSVVANKILSAVRNDVAAGTKISPKFDIVPATTDETDKATAKACDKIFPYLQRINDKHLYRQAVILWYDIDGKGWRKVFWDPEYKLKGQDEQGQPQFEGEVIVEPVPNTELIYDFRAKDLTKLSWIIHRKTITLGEVIKRYGLDFAYSISSNQIYDENAKTDSFEAEILGEFAKLSDEIAPVKVKPSESELIKYDKLVQYNEFWHIPDKTMPVGSYAVLIGDRVAENRPYPIDVYAHGQLPFIPVAPMQLWGIAATGISPISQARPLQREYNEIRSMIKDGSDAMGNSVFVVSRNANIDYKKVDNRMGNIIEYDGTYKPSREQGIPLSGSLFAHLDTIRRDLDEIFAFHEPSKGIMPEGGPRSAIGLQVLQEADNTQLSPIVRAFEVADERVVYQMLSLAITNYGERILQIVGKDNQWTVEKISSEELNGHISVIVKQGSSLPISKSAEQEKMVFAWQSGLLGNPQNPSVRAKVIKSIDIDGFDNLIRDNAKDIQFAQKEFITAEKMAMQMPQYDPSVIGYNEDGTLQINDGMTQALFMNYIYIPPINDFDDHAVHLEEHRNYLMDKYHEYLSTGMPHFALLAQGMRDHMQMHAQMMMMQQAVLSGGMGQPYQERNAGENEPKSKSDSENT